MTCPKMNRREAMAALASTATLPLLHGCRETPMTTATDSTAEVEAGAGALLDEGQLEGRRVGRQWLVSRESVQLLRETWRSA